MSDAEFEDEINNEAFSDAAEYLQYNHKNFVQADLLEFYGLYKQATIGKCNTTKPGMFNIQGKAKWNIWNELGDMTCDAAKEKYIRKMISLVPNYRQIGNTSSGSSKKTHRVKVSTMKEDSDDELADNDKTIIDFVKEGNFDCFKRAYHRLPKERVNDLDPAGLAMIHWAADRGSLHILDYLIADEAININLIDSDGSTALHYAAFCGHIPCVQLLLNHGADRTITDNDDQTCCDVASNDNIIKLLTT